MAQYLRCSERHIQNLTRHGLPHFRLGALLRFHRDELEAYLLGNERLARHRARKVQIENLNAQEAPSHENS